VAGKFTRAGDALVGRTLEALAQNLHERLKLMLKRKPNRLSASLDHSLQAGDRLLALPKRYEG
jgi:hypothetical protein